MIANYSQKKYPHPSPPNTPLRDLLSLIFLFMGTFTALSLYSFVPTDPSWFTATQQASQNFSGLAGSHWSAILIHFFGAGAFLLCFLFFVLGIIIFQRLERYKVLLISVHYLFLLTASCAMLGFFKTKLHFQDNIQSIAFPLGGIIGQGLSVASQEYFNLGGMILITTFIFILSLRASFQITTRELGLYTWWTISKIFLFIFATLVNFSTKIGFFLAWTARQIFLLISTPNWRKFFTYQAHRDQFLLWFSQLGHPYGQQSRTPPPPLEQEEELNNCFLPNLADRPPRKKILTYVQRIQHKNDQYLRTAMNNKKYILPPVILLRNPQSIACTYSKAELYENSQRLQEAFSDFKIQGTVTAVKPGPVITMYEFRPGTGVKVNSITNLADDLALALSAQSVRIEAPIPGRDVVGIEVPNQRKEEVYLKDIIDTKLFSNKNYSIPIALGKDTLGKPVVADLKKMPHMLIAGTTGSGKSVFINSLICSLLYRCNPEELKLIMVDPKQLELNCYEGIPHLLLPIVTEAKKASLALRWAVQEMERRYTLIAQSGTRDIDNYNQKIEETGEENIHKQVDLLEEEPLEKLPKIIVIIDELADLMMTAKSSVETNICLLAQKARAAGIHLVLATQRPSVDVITGLIKANLPARLSFRLSSKIDSRTIFDFSGAERLVGNGDMLFMPPGESRLVRMHGAFISEEEIANITAHWRTQSDPEYRDDILIDPDEESDSTTYNSDGEDLFQEAVDITLNMGYVSSSMLQRRFRIGYNRAARMVDQMEAQGIVGPADGAKPRPVLIK